MGAEELGRGRLEPSVGGRYDGNGYRAGVEKVNCQNGEFVRDKRRDVRFRRQSHITEYMTATSYMPLRKSVGWGSKSGVREWDA